MRHRSPGVPPSSGAGRVDVGGDRHVLQRNVAATSRVRTARQSCSFRSSRRSDHRRAGDGSIPALRSMHHKLGFKQRLVDGVPDPNHSQKWDASYPALEAGTFWRVCRTDGPSVSATPMAPSTHPQLQGFRITDIDGHSVIERVGGFAVSGSVGRIRYVTTDAEVAPTLDTLWRFAEFVGIGNYTTRGLGRVRVETQLAHYRKSRESNTRVTYSPQKCRATCRSKTQTLSSHGQDSQFHSTGLTAQVCRPFLPF